MQINWWMCLNSTLIASELTGLCYSRQDFVGARDRHIANFLLVEQKQMELELNQKELEGIEAESQLDSPQRRYTRDVVPAVSVHASNERFTRILYFPSDLLQTLQRPQSGV